MIQQLAIPLIKIAFQSVYVLIEYTDISLPSMYVHIYVH